MKPVTCLEVDHNLWRYIDRELSASELASISSHLRACDDCRASYLDRAREASQYRQVFVGSPFGERGERFVARFRKRMREEGLHNLAAQPGWRGVSFHRRRLFRIATVAAMVILIPVVVIVGFLAKHREGVLLGDFTTAGGPVAVYRAASPSAQLPASELRVEGNFAAGDQLVLDPGVTAALRLGSPSWRDESRLMLTGPAHLLFDLRATRSEFLARLTRGRLVAEVEEREPSEAFVITTPHAIAKVVGTVFELEVTPEETRLTVTRGTVSFEAADALPLNHVHVTPESGTYVVRAGETKPEPFPAVEVELGAGTGEPTPAPTAAAEPARGEPLDPDPETPGASGVIPVRPDVEPPAGPAPPPAAGDPRPDPRLPDLDTPGNVPPERE